MKTSEAFKQALDRLWDGVGEDMPWNKNRYICVALDHTDSTEAALRCQRIISKLLDPTGKQNPDTLEDWLIDQGHLSPDFKTFMSVYEYPDLRQKVQTTRKAWLKHLIKHYKSIGD